MSLAYGKSDISIRISLSNSCQAKFWSLKTAALNSLIFTKGGFLTSGGLLFLLLNRERELLFKFEEIKSI